MINNNCFLPGLIPHTAHGLLYVQRKRLRGPQKDCTGAVWHVKPFADKVNITKYLNITVSECVYHLFPLKFIRFPINMRGGYPGSREPFCHLPGMLY